MARWRSRLTPDPQANSDVARVDDDLPVRTTFARQEPNPRRIAMWSGAVLVLLALLAVGAYQFRQEPRVGRVLDVLGINLGTGAGSTAAVPVPAVGPAVPQETPPIAADAGVAKPVPTERNAADSPTGASEPASAAGATEPASTAGPIAADTGDVKAMPTEPTPADTPAAVAQPPVPAPPPARVAQRPAPRGPASPREVCGERTQFSLYRCMQTQCSQRQWASHAQCERLRTTDSVD